MKHTEFHFMFNMDKVVSLDIGGKMFKIKTSTINRIDGTCLNKLDPNIEIHSFERDPHLFRHILNAYRYGLVHVPRDVCPILFKEELLFWNIPLTLVSPCCWKILYEVDNDIDNLKVLINNENRFENNEETEKAQESIRRTVFGTDHSRTGDNPIEDKKESRDIDAEKQNTLWLFLDEPGSSAAAKIWCFFYIAVVIISVIAYVIWLDPRVRVSLYLSENPSGIDIFSNETVYQCLKDNFTEKGVLFVFSDPHPALFAVDLFCVVFFITETVLHFFACPNKLKYFQNVYHLTKLLLCVAMVISTFFEIRKDQFYYNERLGYLYFICKSLNAIRLLLIFRLHRLYNRLHIMLLSLTYSCKELGLLLFSFLIAVVVYGCLIFSAEINSRMFESTYISMWWSLITMTTIGYGDFYPTTSFGYVVGVICAVNGIVVLALPIAAIAGTFSNLFSRNTDFQKHKMASKKQKRLDGYNNNCLMKVSTTEMKKEKVVVFTPYKGEKGDEMDTQRNTKQNNVSDLPTIQC